MVSHLPAITFPVKHNITSESNHTQAIPGRLMSVTWYLRVFGHGAEKARLNPSMMPFSGFVTPGERPTSGTPSARRNGGESETTKRDPRARTVGPLEAYEP